MRLIQYAGSAFTSFGRPAVPLSPGSSAAHCGSPSPSLPLASCNHTLRHRPLGRHPVAAAWAERSWLYHRGDLQKSKAETDTDTVQMIQHMYSTLAARRALPCLVQIGMLLDAEPTCRLTQHTCNTIHSACKCRLQYDTIAACTITCVFRVTDNHYRCSIVH